MCLRAGMEPRDLLIMSAERCPYRPRLADVRLGGGCLSPTRLWNCGIMEIPNAEMGIGTDLPVIAARSAIAPYHFQFLGSEATRRRFYERQHLQYRTPCLRGSARSVFQRRRLRDIKGSCDSGCGETPRRLRVDSETSFVQPDARSLSPVTAYIVQFL